MRGEQRLKRDSQQDGWMGVRGERRGIKGATVCTHIHTLDALSLQRGTDVASLNSTDGNCM